MMIMTLSVGKYLDIQQPGGTQRHRQLPRSFLQVEAVRHYLLGGIAGFDSLRNNSYLEMSEAVQLREQSGYDIEQGRSE